MLLAAGAVATGLGSCYAETDASPGEFDYYVLVLSWSPSHCELDGRKKRDPQCARNEPRSFTLHGLWPQYEKGWPLDCATESRPWVPREVIDAMLDIMPSARLIIHEYRAHGTCSGLTPRQYFSTARDLYETVRIPPRFGKPNAEASLSPRVIEQEFLAANDWLRPDMISVTCRGRSLLDVRVCFGKDLFPTPCGINEDEKRLCNLPEINVPAAIR
jgi:ribonuclease T2